MGLTSLQAQQPQVAPADGARSRACPACGRTTAHAFRFRINGCDILQCGECGLGRTDTAAFDPAAYYTEDYFSGRRAYGFFLNAAARYFDVAGIELVQEAAAHGRHAGLNVLQGTADAANLQRIGKVDVIVLFDVIEHLPQPRETLALCRDHLNGGGIIVITTGDFGSPAARLTGARWRLMTPPQHLWFFTQPSMRRLSSALGLSLEHLDHPWKIVPASLIAFQLRRMLGLVGERVTTASRIGVPVNLFDAMRVVLRKPG